MKKDPYYRGVINPATTRRQKGEVPLLLETYPKMKDSLNHYDAANLKNLGAEMLHLSYLHETALPVAVQIRANKLGRDDFTGEELLAENRLRNLSIRTVQRWMNALGYSYCESCGHSFVNSYYDQFLQKRSICCYWKAICPYLHYLILY